MSAACAPTRRRSTTSPATTPSGSRRARSSKASGPAASRCCCSPIRSTPSGSHALGFDGKPFKSVTQGAADLGDRRWPRARPRPAADVVGRSRDAARLRQADAGRGRRPTCAPRSRLTESAACLVAPEHGPDRGLERMLAGAGARRTATKPVLEINPRHALVSRFASAREAGSDPAFVENATRLLLDEARVPGWHRAERSGSLRRAPVAGAGQEPRIKSRHDRRGVPGTAGVSPRFRMPS